MNARSCYRHPMNRLALGFFIAALVCFGAFHFVPMGGRDRGWDVWMEVYRVVKAGRWVRLDAVYAMLIGFLLGWSLEFLTGPILIPFVCWNKLICRLMAFVSFGALVGFGWLMRETSADNPFLWILSSQAFHFLGCLCIRRPQPEEFVPAPPPGA